MIEAMAAEWPVGECEESAISLLLFEHEGETEADISPAVL